MDALAVRVGHLEAGLDAVRLEVVALQSSAPAVALAGPLALASPSSGLSPARSGGGGGGSPGQAAASGEAHGAAQAVWVSLFERELEAVRRSVRRLEDGFKSGQVRLTAMEGETATSADLEELGELVLKELQGLQEEVHRLSGAPGPPPASEGTDSPALGPGGAASAFLGRRQAHRAEALERLERLERSAAYSASRVAALERELLPAGGVGEATGDAMPLAAASSAGQAQISANSSGSPGGTTGRGNVGARLQQLEADVQVALEPLRRHAVSLRALEETSAKVEELARAVKENPALGAGTSPLAAVQGLEVSAKHGSGILSIMDAYRLQSMLDQAMAAMEALSRQRNDDVKLVNGYLSEVYARLERDLVKDGGIAQAAPFKQMRTEVLTLSTKVESLATVQLQDIEDRVLHESRLAQEAATSCAKQVAELREVAKRAAERAAETEVQLRSLQHLADGRSAALARGEASVSETQREVAKLRAQVTEMSQGYKGLFNVEVEARIAAIRAELEAHVDRQAREAGKFTDALAREVQALRERSEGAQAGGSGAGSSLREDVERLCKAFEEVRGQGVRSDIELRERMAQGERELRQEIRAAQRLMLEVAEQVRSSSRPQMARTAAAAALAEAGAQLPQLGDVPLSTLRPPSPPRDGGEGSKEEPPPVGEVVNVADGTVEWRISGVRKLARQGDRRMLISSPFIVPRLAALAGVDSGKLQLKLFPLGSRKQTTPGHCSLYLTGPEGAHLQFLLGLGSAQHGPLECFFDRPGKVTGRHDFCMLEDELEADGSAVVRLTVLQVTVSGVTSSLPRSVSPSPAAGADGSGGVTVRF